MGSASQTNSSLLVKPDSLFSASGRAVKGNLTQWRWGIQGRIGLDIESGEPIRRSWGFSMDGPGGQGLYGLLTLPNSSILLHFSSDFSQVDAVEPDRTAFDLTSRTLHAHRTKSGSILQATESCVVLLSDSRILRHSWEDMLGIPGIWAENAFCVDNALILSTYNKGSSQLHTVSIGDEGVHTVRSWSVSGEVTCLSLFEFSGNYLVIIGSVVDSVSWISVYAMDGKVIVTEAVDRRKGRNFGILVFRLGCCGC
jgi:hypothetical protein